MSWREYKNFKKNGFTYDPTDPRGEISATVTSIPPKNPDRIKNLTGALAADYYVDIDISNKKVAFKGNTKKGRMDIKIKDNISPSDIVNSGFVKKR